MRTLPHGWKCSKCGQIGTPVVRTVQGGNGYFATEAFICDTCLERSMTTKKEAAR